MSIGAEKGVLLRIESRLDAAGRGCIRIQHLQERLALGAGWDPAAEKRRQGWSNIHHVGVRITARNNPRSHQQERLCERYGILPAVTAPVDVSVIAGDKQRIAVFPECKYDFPVFEDVTRF